MFVVYLVACGICYRVPTDLESPGILLVGLGKTACIIRLRNCCCDIVSDQNRDKLVWIELLLLFCYF